MSARTAVAAAEPPRRPVSAVDVAVGDAVWVHVSGQWLQGEVIQRGWVRVRVRYVDRQGTRRDRWWACSTREPVYDGRLAAPRTVRCQSARCGRLLTGLPGQSDDEIQAAHEVSADHYRDQEG